MQLQGGATVILTADTRAAGLATTDAISWAVADPTVASLEVCADSRAATAQAQAAGRTVITVTDTSTDPPLAATVDVLAGGTPTIAPAAGEVTTA